MKLWKALSVAAFLGVALWVLSPSRSISAEPGVVAISYFCDSGPNSAAVEDAIRAFESDSRQAHAQDASRPIYRAIRGQNASRDLTADPTRFLVGVADSCRALIAAA